MMTTEESFRQDPATAELMEQILYEVKRIVVGQDRFLERVMVALLAGGHLLVEGVPGLAKTLTVKTLAGVLQGQFKRIQFTPDLVPADLIGTRIYNQRDGDFSTALGPVFTNLLLADEINRAPAKVQSALLEVMQERQVTIAGQTHFVPEPFLVMATQNPMDHAGTFALPESQLDRFACVLHLGHPGAAAERAVRLGEAGTARLDTLRPAMDLAQWKAAQAAVREVHLSEAVLDYAIRVAARVRRDGGFCSTRALGHWVGLARAEAWLAGRAFLTPDDLQACFGDAMAHRGTLNERHLNREERRGQLARTLNETPVGWQP